MLLFLPLPGHFSCPATFPIRRESSARRLTNGTERIGRSLDAALNDECASHFYGGQAAGTLAEVLAAHAVRHQIDVVFGVGHVAILVVGPQALGASAADVKI